MCQWRNASSTLALLVVLGCSAASQTPARPALSERQRVEGFDGARAWGHLKDQVAIGPRAAGTPANAETRQYIIKTLAASRIAAVEQPFESDTPIGRVKMANVIATLPGDRPERIILASHFDTKRFKDIHFVGASDSASSTAALLEIGRVLKDKPRPFTIELLFLDGEEAFVNWEGTDHTYGSRYYVQAAQKAGSLKSIKALILLDMIGDRNLNIRREENSTRWLTDIIWSTAQRLGHQQHFLQDITPIEDDHLEFLHAGVAAVDIIDLDYPAWHTAQDTLDNVSQRSLQIVGDVVIAALPLIEQQLLKQ
jgi:Zn-dependent M28 family amino/carboxypeptidase